MGQKTAHRAGFSLVSINVEKACVYVGSMDRQVAEWILMKLCKHDSLMPTTVFQPKNPKMLPLVGKRGFLFFHF